VDFCGASLADHAHHAGGIGAADNGVVDQHDLLASQDRAVRGQLHPHPGFPGALGGLDKGPPDVVVADDPHLEGKAGLLGEAEGCRDA